MDDCFTVILTLIISFIFSVLVYAILKENKKVKECEKETQKLKKAWEDHEKGLPKD